MVCCEPLPGAARWTVRLVAGDAVKQKLVPQVGRETIRVLLARCDASEHSTCRRGAFRRRSN